MFALSKVYEFGDTVFIVLRKQKLLTLHWVHHILTCIFAWYTMFSMPANSRWLATMNFTVHSVMYSYYALMASGWRVPSGLAQILTLVQIAQMVVGLGSHTLALVLGTDQCKQPLGMAISGTVMYAIFLVLFVDFFMDKYGKGGKTRKNGVTFASDVKEKIK